MASISQRIAGELNAKEWQVQAAIDLLDSGATVPFIARYRKEATGTLDDAQLRTLDERLRYLRELEERRTAILASIESQGKLDDALRRQILSADTKARLEDLYLPYKPKRRTKAQIAREAGLEPLAESLLAHPERDPKQTADTFVDAEKGIATVDAALGGARAILVERFAEDADLVGQLRETYWRQGRLTSAVREGKKAEGAKFSDYFDFAEPLTKLPSHRILALFRGEKEEVLDLRFEEDKAAGEAGYISPYEGRIALRGGLADRGRPGDRWLMDTVRWAWRTKLRPSVELDLRIGLWQAAEDEAVRVFAGNLRDLLLAAPAGTSPTLGLDPGFRTGVKVAVVDGTGKVVATDAIYPHEPKRLWDEAVATLARLCRTHKVELVAIGNGTASRETDKLAGDLLARHPDLKLTKVMVSEAGASVYSASAYASQELPDLDVSLRGAVSIARRLQDPLAELVKIDPKSIGVGQYQHDLSEHKLSRSLDAAVEDCVNAVGVDVNTASAPAYARVGSGRMGGPEHRGPPQPARPLPDPQGPQAGDGFRAEDVRAVGRVLAHSERGRSARRLGRTPEGLPGRAPDPESGKKRHQGSDRQRHGPEGAPAGGLHGRDLRAADRDGHPEGTGEDRPGSAPGVQNGSIPRGHRELGGPEARDGAGGGGDERRGVRGLCECRRTSGRVGAHLGPGEHVRQRPAQRGQAGRRGACEGAGGGPSTQAHRAHDAAGRRGRAAPRARSPPARRCKPTLSAGKDRNAGPARQGPGHGRRPGRRPPARDEEHEQLKRLTRPRLIWRSVNRSGSPWLDPEARPRNGLRFQRLTPPGSDRANRA